MKKASLKILICLMLVLALGSVLVACNRNRARQFDHYVTFDYNVGNLPTTPLNSQYVGVKDGSHITIRPGYSDNINEKSISGYYIEGWYTAVVDAEGNPIKDSDGFVQLDKKWDFNNQIVNKSFTLYANFQIQMQYSIKFVDIKTGTESETVLSGKPDSTKSSPSGGPKLSGYTFFGKYYVDKEKTAEVTWPFKLEKEENVIYVDFIKGENLNFVSTASDFAKMMTDGKSIYLLNDIVFTEEDRYWVVGTYNGELNGNNHTITITGLTRKFEASKAGSVENKACIFGTLGAKANIHDVTFIGGSVEYTFGGVVDRWSVGFFAWKALDGAKVSNVTVTDAKLTYDTNGLITGAAGIAINNAKAEDIDLNVDGVEVIRNDKEVQA